jgi:hypothetical protein
MERSDKKENAADQVIVKKECLQSTNKSLWPVKDAIIVAKNNFINIDESVVTLSLFLF